MRNRLRNLARAHTVLDGLIEVIGQRRRLIAGDQRRDGDEAAIPRRQTGTLPHITVQTFLGVRFERRRHCANVFGRQTPALDIRLCHLCRCSLRRCGLASGAILHRYQRRCDQPGQSDRSGSPRHDLLPRQVCDCSSAPSRLESSAHRHECRRLYVRSSVLIARRSSIAR